MLPWKFGICKNAIEQGCQGEYGATSTARSRSRFVITSCNIFLPGDIANLPFLPIDFAIQHKQKAIFDYLLTEGKFDPKTKNFAGLTALHYAALHGNLSMVRDLVEKYKMDHQILTVLGKEPVYYASQRNHFEIVKYLLKFPRRESAFDMTESMEHAVEKNNYQLIKLLGSKGVTTYNPKYSHPMLDATRISLGVCASDFSQRVSDLVENHVVVNFSKKKIFILTLVNIFIILLNIFFVTYTAIARPKMIPTTDERFVYVVLRVIVIYLEFVVVWFFTITSWGALFFHLISEAPKLSTLLWMINMQSFSVVKWILRPPVIVEALRKLMGKGVDLVTTVFGYFMKLRFYGAFCTFEVISDYFATNWNCSFGCSDFLAVFATIFFYLFVPLGLIIAAIGLFTVFVIYTVLPTFFIGMYSCMLFILCLGCLGIGAVLVKLSQMQYLYEKTILNWGFLEYITFFGFLNQVAVTVPVERILIDNHWNTLGQHADVVRQLLYRNLRYAMGSTHCSSWIWGFLVMWTSSSDAIKRIVMLVYDETVAVKKQLAIEVESNNFECLDEMALRNHGLPWLDIATKRMNRENTEQERLEHLTQQSTTKANDAPVQATSVSLELNEIKTA